MYDVIFDMDGVIFDSERTQLECWTEVSAKYSLDEENQRIYGARAKAYGEKAEEFEKAAKAVHSISTEDITKNLKNSVENGGNSDIIKYSYKTDVYDFGVCIYYLFGGKPVYKQAIECAELFTKKKSNPFKRRLN